jgi:hypothetical protein
VNLFIDEIVKDIKHVRKKKYPGPLKEELRSQSYLKPATSVSITKMKPILTK